MEQIIVALITAVVGPLATLAAKHAYDTRRLLPTKGRRENLAGTWRGTGRQNVGPTGEPLEYPVSLNLTVGRKLISGNGTFGPLPSGEHDDFTLNGGFMYGKYLRLRYENNDAGKVQFGAMLLTLSDSGDELEGTVVGYGRLSERIVVCEFTLRKKTP